jgi:pyrroline-5-carboxylate reductase
MHSCMRCSRAALFVLSILTAVNGTGQTPKLSKNQAQAIALKLHPGKIKSAELEKEHGVQMYSFDIETKDGVHEVGIDADSGKVVEDSVESAADEAKEKAAKKSKAH